MRWAACFGRSCAAAARFRGAVAGLLAARVRVWVVLALATAIVCTHGCSKEEPLPELGQLSDFSLVDQRGQPFTRATLKGKVWAAAFMFTRCPTICPALTRAMRGLQVAAQREGVELFLVSFSVDPENDTPQVLTQYAEKHGAELSSWTFVTGDSAMIQKTAEHGFKIGVSGSADETQDHFGITHGSHLVLVDQAGVIRGYYRSSEPEQLDKLIEDAQRLD